jgi:hypothetical protein
MTKVIYKIVRHGEGWAYMVGETYSETFPNQDAARKAAHVAAREQELPGKTVGIAFEDSTGQWHEELSPGSDRPTTRVT